MRNKRGKGGGSTRCHLAQFFFCRNRRDRSPFRGLRVASKGSWLSDRVRVSLPPTILRPPFCSSARSFLGATCPTVFGSRVTKDAEIQKSRRAWSGARGETLFRGARRDREWPRGASHLLALPPRDGSSPPGPFPPACSRSLLSSSTDTPGVLNPFLLSAAAA